MVAAPGEEASSCSSLLALFLMAIATVHCGSPAARPAAIASNEPPFQIAVPDLAQGSEPATEDARDAPPDGGGAKRTCSRGEKKFDGCNWSSCRMDGSGWLSTLLDCRTGITLQIQFAEGSAALSEDQRQRLREATPTLRRMLEPPERKITVVGHVLRGESSVQAALGQIAARRAAVVLKALLREGLPKERLTTRAAPVEDGTSNPPSYRVVTFELEPNLTYASDDPLDAGIH
jgi:outer membrane protein OmpA-like peptidoglycan-associated protein